MKNDSLLGYRWGPLALILVGFCWFSLSAAYAQSREPLVTENAESSIRGCPTLLDHQMSLIDGGEEINLCQYHGSVLLVVNVASKCGFTPQYGGLEQLFRRYQDQGFVVLGFPSNDFFQESGDDAEIAEFCRLHYDVTFPMFKKTSIRGSEANPFYLDLKKASGKGPSWNFYKYLIDREGKVFDFHSSRVSPDATQLVDQIERLLAK